MHKKRYLPQWSGHLASIALITLSLVLFLHYFPIPRKIDMIFSNHDAGDFRWLAEYFWGMKHNLQSYRVDFLAAFSDYLDKIPFRGLLPGSLVIMLQKLVKFLYPAWSGYGWKFIVFYYSFIKVLQFIGYYIFYCLCSRCIGLIWAICLLLPLIFPISHWASSEYQFLAEPILRTFFVVLLGILIFISKRDNAIFVGMLVCMFILFLAAQSKAQWILLAGLLFIPFLIIGLQDRWAIRKLVVLVIATLSIPISLLATNFIGWRYVGLTPGSALHTQVQSNGDFIRSICDLNNKYPKLQTFCNRHEEQTLGWWNIYFNKEVDASTYRLLDRHSFPYSFKTPELMKKNFLQGLLKADNFFNYSKKWKWAYHGLTFFIWTLLLVGLLWRETLLPATLALGLWIIPAVGNMFAIFDDRYYKVMAGIPIVVSILILHHFCIQMKARNIKLLS